MGKGYSSDTSSPLFAIVMALMASIFFYVASAVYATEISATGNLNVARRDHTVTLLLNGKVVVAGGTLNGSSLNSAEVYDMHTGAFSLTTGTMTSSRSSHTATLLPDGKLLITGGISNGIYLDTAEVFDPTSGLFSSTGKMAVPRRYHTATLLRNGKVLLTGGNNATGDIDTAEEYDPVTNKFTLLSSTLVTPRSLHTATLMNSGKVMLIGGAGEITNTETYDPETSRFTLSANLRIARQQHTATLLPTGKILVVGGRSGSMFIGDSEVFDPSMNFFEQTGTLIIPRSHHTATLRPDGKVVIIGGYNGSAIITYEIYEVLTGAFIQAEGVPIDGRYNHSSSLLPDGKILSAGGIDATGNELAGVEIFTTPVEGLFIPSGAALPYQWIAGKRTATLLPDGNVLIIGGLTAQNGQLYEPTTGSFTGVGQNVYTRRSDHSATLLANGKVFIAGGKQETFSYAPLQVYSDSYLYDPATKQFDFAADMLNMRRSHLAYLLTDGKVLIRGGYNSYSNYIYNCYPNPCTPTELSEDEIYDPATNTFSPASNLNP